MKHLIRLAALSLLLGLTPWTAGAEVPVPTEAAPMAAPSADEGLPSPDTAPETAGNELVDWGSPLFGGLDFMSSGSACEEQSCPWENCNPGDCVYQCWKDHLPEVCACPDGDYICHINAQNSMRLCMRSCPI